MNESISGIHHVTAISGDAQQNLDFYGGVLGLRLVKRTVNYDDPNTYHLYYGDDLGRPGTILTFFPWRDVPRGIPGAGEVAVTSFAIPPRAVDYWINRLESQRIGREAPTTRFGDTVISFSDPHGLRLELVGKSGVESLPAWDLGPVPRGFAIRGFHGVTMALGSLAKTTSLLTEVMGFQAVGIEGDRHRFRSTSDALGSIVDLVAVPGRPRGRMGMGTVHHIAWRSAGEDQQRDWRRRVAERGLEPTPVIDRRYFHSIYFREPGGVLFEIATDPPGFAIDETPEELGTELKLPPWLEPMRHQIERGLPPLRMPEPGRVR